MKKNILLTAFLTSFILAACNKSENYPIEGITSSVNGHDQISVTSKAPAIKEHYVSLNDAKKFADAIRPSKSFKIDPYIVEKDTLLYFINYDEGWIILAGDKRLDPFVAESEKGNLSVPTSNENLNAWIDSYADEIRVIRNLTDKKENKYTELWAKISQNKQSKEPKAREPETKAETYKWAVISYTYCDSQTYEDTYPHLLLTKWGQKNPWYTKLPTDLSKNKKCPTGCTAVAISQILYYMHYNFNKPLGLYHTISISKSTIPSKTEDIGFSRSDYVPNSTRWNEMALNASSQSGHSFVGDLMLDVGNQVEMEYSGSGSAGLISNDAMGEYGLTYSEHTYDYQIVKNNIINSKPVKIIAYTQNEEGHTWVIDGIAQRVSRFVTEKRFEYTDNWMHESEYYDSFDDLRYKYNINTEFDVIIEPGGTSRTDFLLMNWGYDGEDDDNYYSTYPSATWEANVYEFEYNKIIYYDFR